MNRARVSYDPEWAEYSSDGHKLLSDNRAAYIAQSAATRDGNVAPIPRPAGTANSPPRAEGGAGNLSPQEQAK